MSSVEFKLKFKCQIQIQKPRNPQPETRNPKLETTNRKTNHNVKKHNILVPVPRYL